MIKMRYRYITFALLLLCSTAAARPRLAVNIVVSSMRSTDIDRYGHNFGDGGFRRLTENGATFSECYLGYAQTHTPAGAATIATGAMPATHGIVSEIWYDRTTNKPIRLCENVVGNYSRPDNGISDAYSADCMVAQTLAEAVLDSSPKSKAITIAHTPQSAIITAGGKGECYWLDDKGRWSSAKCYTTDLPTWVRNYNDDEYNKIFSMYRWYGKYTRSKYLNSRSSALTLYETDTKVKNASRKSSQDDWVATMTASPSGNTAILEFAKRAIGTLLPIKVGDGSRILNIYLDTPRIIAEKYGPDSIEYEDMLYCLDDAIAEFLTFLYAQTDKSDEIVVSLTSDHGTSPSHIDKPNDGDRFNYRQFEVIINAFLSARYGQDEWVLGYHDNSLYLNHDVIYKRKKSLADIRDEVAAFALQFRGVAYAVSATSLQNDYFGSGTVHLMQNGFYPRRSGDVAICLMPNRIDEKSDTVSLSGSPYAYDRHIPLVIYGGGVAPQRIDKRTDITSLAPTLAKMLGADRPSASDAEIIEIERQ